MATKSEFLLLSAESESPFSTALIDPATGQAAWAHKGNELRGAAVKFAENVGTRGDFMFVGSATQNICSIISPARFQPINCYVRSPVESCCIDRDGIFGYFSLQHKIFTYNIRTGELVKISSNVSMRFNKIVLCYNNKYLAVPSTVDGAIYIVHTKDLVTRSSFGENIEPYRTLRGYKSSIEDVCFASFDSSRLLTVGEHQAILWSIPTETQLVKLSVDEKLTTCALNATELAMFLGTETGKLIMIGTEKAKFQISESDFLMASKSTEESEALQIVDKHNSKVLKIALNLDESRGASGDENGIVYIWDTLNLLTLFKIQKSGPIRILKFVPPFKSVTDIEYQVDQTKIKALNREMAANLNATVQVVATGCESKWQKRLDELATWMKTEAPSTMAFKPINPQPSKTTEVQPAQKVPLKTLSKSARRRLAKQKRQVDFIAEPEQEMEVDEDEEEQDNYELKNKLASLEAELEKAKKMNTKLVTENKKLYDFAKGKLE